MNKIKDKIDTIQYISLKNAAELCSYSQDYLSLRARQGKLKAMKIGRNWMTTQEWLDDYVIKANDYNTEHVNKRSVSKNIKKDIKKESVLKKIPDFGKGIESALIKVEKNALGLKNNLLNQLAKVKNIAEKYIGTSIDKGLSVSINPMKPKLNPIKPKLALSAALISFMLIGSFFAFNPQARASVSNLAQKSVSKIIDSGRGIAEFVFKQGQNISLLVENTKKSSGNLFDNIIVKSPQLIEESTQSIEKVSSKANSGIKDKAIGLSERSYSTIKFVPGLIKGFYGNVDDFIVYISKSPRKISKFAINVNQKNEDLKLSIKYSVKDTSEKIVQIPLKIGKLPNKVIYAFINLNDKNEDIKSLFSDKIHNTPNLISLKINGIIHNLSDTYASISNTLSDTPRKLSDIPKNVIDKLFYSYEGTLSHL